MSGKRPGRNRARGKRPGQAAPRGSNRARLEKEAAAAAAQRRRRTLTVGGAAAGVAILFVIVALATSQRSTTGIAGERRFTIGSPKHVTTPVSYAQTPPVGGDHNPTWQNCGTYTEPIKTEQGVHSLEHGAVWITHRPDLAEADRDALSKLASTYLVVSPWSTGLPAPIVASAWGYQITADSVSDPRLAAFVSRHRQSQSAPEPGAPCTGGSGTPS